MHRVLTAAVLLAATLALAHDCPPSCDCVSGDELEFYCPAGSPNVYLASRTNEYVKVNCMGPNITCADLPSINLSNNLTLPALGVTDCAPSLLRCVTGALQAASVTSMVVENASHELRVEDLQHMQELESLMLKSGPEKTVPVNIINSLKHLRNFRITTSNIHLISNAFMNAQPIEFLELSSDKITSLPEDAFNGLSKLTILNIWGNNFSHVGENSFRGLESLQQLALNTNHITSIATGAFAYTPRLQLLSLLANFLEELPTSLLSNLRDLENVTIQLNRVELKLQPKSFSNLTSLKNLFLNVSQIKILPEDLLWGSYNIRKLLLNNNEISSLPVMLFKDQKNLEHLDLSYNKIASLDRNVFGSLRELKYLNLNRNHLEVVPDGLFAGLTKLKSISIDNNYLTTIYDDSFLGATSLVNLSLSNNRLDFKPIKTYDYKNGEMPSSLYKLTSLKRLNLSGNQIDNIFDDWRFNLLNLEVLDLSWNKLTEIKNVEVQFAPASIRVDLRHNNITTLYLEPVSSITSNTELPNSSILLDENPFNCDCDLYRLALRLKGARPLTIEPQLIVGGAKCAEPSHLKGQLVSSVSLKELNCDLPENSCSEPCTKCVERPAYNDIDFDCITTPNIFPNRTKFGSKYISLKLHKVPTYVGNLTLNLLNLSNIGLKDIPFEPNNAIKVFDFSHNDLSKIPVNFLKGNSTLYLAGNNFECDCWYSNEISMLQKSLLVKDLDLVTCSNGDRLKLVDVVALCSSWRAAAVASGTFIAMVIIVFFIALTIYKYSHEILVYIIDHGLFPWCFKEELTDADKEFDVFISFAHKDRKYLRELLPKIENEFGQKTCLHYRDWYAGDLIPTQIERSVESSRKTLILLSRNFLESHYANMEFQAAHNLALKQGKTRVILILLEDVSKNEKLSDELKAYMSTNTYLKWDDPRFWERLEKALPRRLTKKFVFPDVFKQADIKTVSSGLDVHLNSDNKLVNIAVKDV